jgi:hypothetical protein
MRKASLLIFSLQYPGRYLRQLERSQGKFMMKKGEHFRVLQ